MSKPTEQPDGSCPIDHQLFEQICNDMEKAYGKDDDNVSFHDVGALRGYIHSFLGHYFVRLPKRESGEPYLHNRADGVDGHYCIARKSPRGDFYEYYEAGKWVSATSLIFHLGKTNEIEDEKGKP